MRRKVLMAAAFFLATSDYCAATKPTPIPLEEQIRIFTQRIAENPNNRGAYHHARAKVYGNLGDYDKVLADIKRACVETDLLACSAFRQFQERHGQ
jgi:tetratricopeptide (TPR) repeat protein